MNFAILTLENKLSELNSENSDFPDSSLEMDNFMEKLKQNRIRKQNIADLEIAIKFLDSL